MVILIRQVAVNTLQTACFIEFVKMIFARFAINARLLLSFTVFSLVVLN